MNTSHVVTSRGVVEVIYLTRADWGATGPHLGHVIDEARFTKLNIHHTVMVLRDYDGDGYTHGDLDDIKKYMRALKTSRPDLGLDVPYSFVVFRGANPMQVVICEGRGKGHTGAHTRGQNSSSYGVAYAANTMVEEVTWGMEEGVRWTGRTMLVNPAGARATTGHWESKATACQGTNGRAVQGRQQPPFQEGLMTTPEEEVHGMYGMLTRELGDNAAATQNLGHSIQFTNNQVANVVVPKTNRIDDIERKVDALTAAVARIEQAIADLPTDGGGGGPITLPDAEVERIAAATISLLSSRTQP